jgi:nickel/cobalt transporter (NicO) family protein
MNATTPALVAAAAGVGFGHAILPDHWMPLAVLGRTRRYPLSRVARLSGLAGLAHVLASIVLGGVVILVGLQFRSTLQGAQDTIIGAILILTGLAFVALELSGHGHQHHDREHQHHDHGHQHHDDEHQHHDDEHRRDHERVHHIPPVQSHRPSHARRDREIAEPAQARGEHRSRGRLPRARALADVMVPFGAAASPDLTILPVFLAAAAVGATTAIGSLLVFAGVTIVTVVGLTLTACFGGYQMRGEWLERWGSPITALVLVVIGALVLAQVI